MISHGKSANRHSFLDQWYPVGSGRRLCADVIRNHAADNNPAMYIHPVEDLLLNRASRIFEKDVYTFGRQILKRQRDVISFVVDCAIKSEDICDPLAFFIITGDANNV